MTAPTILYPYRRHFVRGVSLFAILIGLLGLMDQSFNIDWLSVHLQSIVSAGFILSGCCLYLLSIEKDETTSHWIVIGCSLILLVISIQTIYEYLFYWNTSTSLDKSNAKPFGLSVSEAFNFALLSGVFFQLGLKRYYRESIIIFCFLIFSITIFSLFNSVYNVNPNSLPYFFVHIPFITMMVFFLLCIACILIAPLQGLTKIILEDSSSGKYTRRILVTLFLVPLVVAYLENFGERLQLYTPDFGDSILSTFSFIIMLLIIGINAKLLHNEEQQKLHNKKNLDYFTEYDDVTGLLNAEGFEKFIEDTLTNTPLQSIAIIKLDLNQLELITNVSGYVVGDVVLNKLKDRYKNSPVLAQAVIARVGIKEFGFILKNTKNVFEVANKVNKILEITSEIITINGKNIFLTGSAGISLYPENGRDVDALIIAVDQALHLAKKQVGNSFQFFTSNLSLALSDRLEIENALHYAITENQFKLYYQPQLDIATGKVCGAEALIRWEHPVKGLISPTIFVPVAESTGLIVALGEWILREVCKQIQNGWPFLESGKESCFIPIAINVSSTQFSKGYAIESVFERIIKEYKIDPTFIEIEITESVLMQDMKVNLQRLAELKKIGFKLSIDDFGTGFSSFSYINSMPNDKVKIDKSFLDELPDNKNEALLVKAIIDMFHQLNKKIVAEGVETKAQYDFLKDNKCDVIQGYYFSKPLTIEEFKKFVNLF